MKKTILALLLLAASAATVQAAAIKWAIGGIIDAPADKPIDTTVGSFVLAYLGVTSGQGVTAAEFATGLAESNYEIVQEKDWGDFYSDRKGVYSSTQTYTSTAARDVNGATYQAFYTVDGNYYLVNDPTIATIAVSVNAQGMVQTDAYLNGSASGGNQLYAAGGSTAAITSVPEPSVALMGLLGLGMLLKRRRA